MMMLFIDLIVCLFFSSEMGDSDRKAAYRWLPKQEEIQKEERLKASRKKADSPSSVSKQFCPY